MCADLNEETPSYQLKRRFFLSLDHAPKNSNGSSPQNSKRGLSWKLSILTAKHKMTSGKPPISMHLDDLQAEILSAYPGYYAVSLRIPQLHAEIPHCHIRGLHPYIEVYPVRERLVPGGESLVLWFRDPPNISSSGSRGGGGWWLGGLNPPFRVFLCFFCLSVYENSHGPGP